MEIKRERFLKVYKDLISTLGDNFWCYGFWRFIITMDDGSSELCVYNGTYEDAEDIIEYRVYDELGYEKVLRVELVCNALVPFADNCDKCGCDGKKCMV